MPDPETAAAGAKPPDPATTAAGAKPAKTRKSYRVAGFIILGLIFSGIYFFFAWIIQQPQNINAIVLRPTVGDNQYYKWDPIAGIKKKTLYVEAADGSKLHCWLFPVAGSDRIAIVSHGNAGNISNRFYIANALTKAGCSVLLYDYRGYGLSTGNPTISGILADGLSVYDYVHDKLHFPDNKIFLYGESIGSGVTSNLAVNRPCAGVILQSGIASLPAMGRKLFPMLYVYPDFAYPEPHLDNVAAMEQITAPILFLHGKKDTIVPFQHSQEMFAGAHEPKQIVLLEDCGHNDMGVQNTEQFQGSIKAFVEKVSSQQNSTPQNSTPQHSTPQHSTP